MNEARSVWLRRREKDEIFLSYSAREFQALSWEAVTSQKQIDHVDLVTYPLTVECDSRGLIKTNGSGRKYCLESVDLSMHLNLYALVDEGWLPVTFVIPPKFIIDRNVISALKNSRGGSDTRYEKWMWWIDSLRNESISFSDEVEFDPVFAALEGVTRKPPSFEQFCTELENISTLVRDVLPWVRVRKVNEQELNRYFHFSKASGYECKRKFLLGAIPLILNRTSERGRSEKLKQLIRLAKDVGLDKVSHVFVLALSCLYDSPAIDLSVGRKVLKPKESFGINHCHNSICDLLLIDYLMLNKREQIDNYSAMTADKWLAVYWSMITPRLDEGTDIFSFEFFLNLELFNGASDADLTEIAKTLAV